MQVYVPLEQAQDLRADQALRPRLRPAAREGGRPSWSPRSWPRRSAAGKVFIDWSQNDEHKTTVCVYSLRARERPTVSTPLRWEEVEQGDPDALVFEAGEVLERAEEHGDLFEPVLTARAEAAPAVAWVDGRLVACESGGALRRRLRPAGRPRTWTWPPLVAETEGEVAAHTRLTLAEPVPPPELVGRREWAEANLAGAVAAARPGGGPPRPAARRRPARSPGRCAWAPAPPWPPRPGW